MNQTKLILLIVITFSVSGAYLISGSAPSLSEDTSKKATAREAEHQSPRLAARKDSANGQRANISESSGQLSNLNSSEPDQSANEFTTESESYRQSLLEHLTGDLDLQEEEVAKYQAINGSFQVEVDNFFLQTARTNQLLDQKTVFRKLEEIRSRHTQEVRKLLGEENFLKYSSHKAELAQTMKDKTGREIEFIGI